MHKRMTKKEIRLKVDREDSRIINNHTERAKKEKMSDKQPI